MFWTLLLALPCASALPTGSISARLAARYDEILHEPYRFPTAGIAGIVVPIVFVGLAVAFYQTSGFGMVPTTNLRRRDYVRTSDEGSGLPCHHHQGEKFAPFGYASPIRTKLNTPWAPEPRSPPPAYTPTGSPKLNDAASEWPRPAAR